MELANENITHMVDGAQLLVFLSLPFQYLNVTAFALQVYFHPYKTFRTLNPPLYEYINFAVISATIHLRMLQ
jgi:hypothetical protein